MKKFIKVCGILGGIMIVAGGIASIVAFAMGARLGDIDVPVPDSHSTTGRALAGKIREGIMEEFDGHTGWENGDLYGEDYGDAGYDRGGMTDWLKEQYGKAPAGKEGRLQFSVSSDSEPDIKKLEVEAQRGSVVLVEEKDPEFIGVYSAADSSVWSAERSGEKLKIKVDSFSWNPGQSSDTVVYVYVPEGFVFDQAEIEAKTGSKKDLFRESNDHGGASIYAETLSARKLEIDIEAGVVEIANGNTEELELNCDVGVAGFSGKAGRSVDAECKVGDVRLELEGTPEDFNYEIEAKVGSVMVGDKTYSGLSSKSGVNNQAAKKMELDCTTGVISVIFK